VQRGSHAIGIEGSSVRFTCTTGTGASGEMRLTSPNQ
jgi:hypothetical protein